jgi:hypothetical protein
MTHFDHKDATIIRTALNIAESVHGTQTDRSGDNYMGHVFRVGMRAYELTASPRTMAVGILHDVIEDSPKSDKWDTHRLIAAGIPGDVAGGVLLLTRDEDRETYDEYITRLVTPCKHILGAQCGHIHVRPAKRADLEDNIGRPGATPELYNRYLKALHRLRAAV